MTDFHSRAGQLVIPITGLTPHQTASESVAVPAGVAGTMVDFYITRKPILDSNNSWIGGNGDSSLALTSTTFDNEVSSSTADADMSNGDYWVNYITGRGRGKKKDTATSMTADYYSFLEGLSGGGTIYGNLTIAGNLIVEETVQFQGLSVNTFTVDGGQMIIDTDNVEAFLVRKDGDLGDVFAINTTVPLITASADLDMTTNDILHVDSIYGSTSILPVRIGDAGTTGHSLNSEDDLLVTGDFEVQGVGFIDGAVTLGSNLSLPSGAIIDWDSSDVILTHSANVLTIDGAIGGLVITNPALGVTPTSSLSLVNSTAATVGTNQYSPSLYMRGSGWKSNAVAASQYTDGQIYMAAGTHTTNAIGTMVFQTRTNAGAWASHFTLNQYGVQSNVATYLNENTIQASNRSFALSSNSDVGFKFSTPQTVDSLLFFLDSTSRTVILTDNVNVTKDHDHSGQANPTLFIHSVKDPDTANDEWMSLTHDGTNGYIDLGSGALSINGAFMALGGVAGTGLADSRISSSGNVGTGWSLVNTSIGGKSYTLFSTGATSDTGPGKFSLFNVTDASYLWTVTSAGEMILGSGDEALTALTGNTFRAPNVKTGGAGNIAGADMTIASGLGTGTGDPGQIIFQVAPVAAAGDNIQTLATVLTLDGADASATFAGSVSAVGVTLSGRLQGDKGGDVASANDITLGTDGNYFDITGTTEMQRILGTGWQAGSVIILQFDGSVQVTHNTAAGSSYFGFQLSGAGNFSATAGDTLQLVFDGAWWRECSRTAI